MSDIQPSRTALDLVRDETAAALDGIDANPVDDLLARLARRPPASSPRASSAAASR